MSIALLLIFLHSFVGSINIENTTVETGELGGHDMSLPTLISTFRHTPLFSTRANVKKSTPSLSGKAISDFDGGSNIVEKLTRIKKRDSVFVTASSFAGHNNLDLSAFPLIYGLKGSVANKIPFEGNQTFTHIKRPHADSGGIDHIKVNMGGSYGGLTLIDYLKFDNEIGVLIPELDIWPKSHLGFFDNYPRLKLQDVGFLGFAIRPPKKVNTESSSPKSKKRKYSGDNSPIPNTYCGMIYRVLGFEAFTCNKITERSGFSAIYLITLFIAVFVIMLSGIRLAILVSNFVSARGYRYSEFYGISIVTLCCLAVFCLVLFYVDYSSGYVFSQ